MRGNMGLQLTGHKYKYVGSLNIVDNDKKYIEELERQVENSLDVWMCTNEMINGGKGFIVELSKLKKEIRELKAELHVIKKFLEKAKRMTNQNFE